MLSFIFRTRDLYCLFLPFPHSLSPFRRSKVPPYSELYLPGVDSRLLLLRLLPFFSACPIEEQAIHTFIFSQSPPASTNKASSLRPVCIYRTGQYMPIYWCHESLLPSNFSQRCRSQTPIQITNYLPKYRETGNKKSNQLPWESQPSSSKQTNPNSKVLNSFPSSPHTQSTGTFQGQLQQATTTYFDISLPSVLYLQQSRQSHLQITIKTSPKGKLYFQSVPLSFRPRLHPEPQSNHRLTQKWKSQSHYHSTTANFTRYSSASRR